VKRQSHGFDPTGWAVDCNGRVMKQAGLLEGSRPITIKSKIKMIKIKKKRR
jgi:hypothetical protein